MILPTLISQFSSVAILSLQTLSWKFARHACDVYKYQLNFKWTENNTDAARHTCGLYKYQLNLKWTENSTDAARHTCGLYKYQLNLKWSENSTDAARHARDLSTPVKSQINKYSTVAARHGYR